MSATSTITGLISGMKTDDIISKLMDIKKESVTKLNTQKATFTSKLTAWQNLNARLLAVKVAANDLQNSSSIVSRTASSSDSSTITASATSSASAGTYTLKVLKLAKAEQIASDGVASTSTSLGAGTIQIKNSSTGQTWTVDVKDGADNLEAIRDSINASGAGAVASIINDGTSSPYRLMLTSNTTGSAGAFEVTASGGTSLNMSTVVTTADNAQVQFGSGATPLTISSSSNTLTDAIPGVTLNLLKENTSDTITVNVTNDNSAAISKVKAFTTAYNSYVSFVQENASYDADTQTAGPLLGEFALQQIESQLGSFFSTSVAGLPAATSSLSSLGITLGSDGTVSLDESTLTAKLNTDPQAVAKVLGRSGTASDASITFVTASSSTVESSVGYAVNITQIATQARLTAGKSLAGTLQASEALTVNGVSIDLSSGMTLDEIINTVNGKTSQTGVVASRTGADGTGTGDYLTLKSSSYGTSAAIRVKSSRSNAQDGSSGFGTTEVNPSSAAGEAGSGTGVAGKDVAGTINGEAATGNGKVLTGMSGNARTAGLTVIVNSTDTGAKGTVTYSRGIAAGLNDTLTSLTDYSTGILTTEQQSVQDKIDSIGDEVDKLTERLDNEQARMEEQFASMEAAMSKYQSQSAYLTAVFSKKNSSSSSS